MKEVKVEALIKKITSKSLVSLDKENEIVFRFGDENGKNDAVLKALVDMHRADDTVTLIVRSK